MSSGYHGNCHCGRFRFELTGVEITEAIVCKCTLCAKKGYLWIRPITGSFNVTRDEGSLTSYKAPTLTDQFCGHCGTGVLGEHSLGSLNGQQLVNIRAIQEVNPFKLGSSIHVAAPDDERPLKRISESSPALHKASCHCGQVQAELLVPITDLEIKEDNCSSCVRDAYIGVYPTKDQVKIHGRENTFEYKYGQKFSGTLYCKICGVTVFRNIYGPPLSVFDKVPADRKERVMAAYWKNMAMQPLNVRTFDGLDLESLKIERTDEGTEGYVLPP
ncbi:hypothetical protein DL546_008635 [Coniochaeta pulveracea]|uniref:CENP-V/GFA domain-containing protein n=1 Tax=Coniochaeta pulveracea TaxID=177199 RepID=A0A420YLW7_9PEZI|nr:hypothetical protein DL546_008635 [Coniochaeta pulveracea]